MSNGQNIGDVIGAIILGIVGGIVLAELAKRMTRSRCPVCQTEIQYGVSHCPQCYTLLSWR